MNNTQRLRFHWSLSAVGDAMRRGQAQAAMSGAFDLDTHTAFYREAEQCGIESLLMAFGFTRPDPFTWSAALGSRTRTIHFLTAIRSGICPPTLFVQQVNTLSVITGGRVYINIVAGRAPGEHRYYGDFLSHDQRYERPDEFWQICHALWRGKGPVDFTGRRYRIEQARINTPFVSAQRDRPKIYLGGNSEQAMRLAIQHEALTAAAAAELIATAGEAAREVHHTVRGATDSVGFRSMYDTADSDSAWVTRYLWTGAVPYLGPPAISLVGSAHDIVEAIFEYRDIGITEFLFTGFPDLEQMRFFAAEVLPRVRERERQPAASLAG